MASPCTRRGFAALALAAVFALGAAAAEAGSRSYSSRGSFVPRSSSEGVLPGAFGRRDSSLDRLKQDRLRIERLQEQSRLRARERVILRKQRGTVTSRRAPPPSNRLTERLYPTVEPLRNLPRRTTNQADVQLYLQSPPTNSRGEFREPVSPRRDSIRSFGHIDRNTR